MTPQWMEMHLPSVRPVLVPIKEPEFLPEPPPETEKIPLPPLPQTVVVLPVVAAPNFNQTLTGAQILLRLLEAGESSMEELVVSTAGRLSPKSVRDYIQRKKKAGKIILLRVDGKTTYHMKE